MKFDQQQLFVKDKLDSLALKIKERGEKKIWRKFLSTKKRLKSLYIYGDVGRGKSMLMKEFFNSLNEVTKLYIHFNSFMRLIHEALRDIRQENKNYKDELIEAVNRVVKKTQLICFDEFQVTDIADAMLLSRIFSHLFWQGVIVVFTSNSKPQNLYQNGLQRELFLKFINDVLLTNCEVMHLDSNIDYRSLYRQNLSERYFLTNSQNCQRVEKIIQELADGRKTRPVTLKVWGRDLKIEQAIDDIAIFDFATLCQNPLSASDYQAICSKFNLIFLLQVPQIMAENSNDARRLTLFIDELYENKVGLIILAAVESDKIYPQGTNSKAFKRTVSRLNEIKSDAYWQNSKINLRE